MQRTVPCPLGSDPTANTRTDKMNVWFEKLTIKAQETPQHCASLQIVL